MVTRLAEIKNAISWCIYDKAEDVREHKSVPVNPVWVLGVEGHEFVEEDVSGGREAHRRSGMTGVCFESRIDLDKGRS